MSARTGFSSEGLSGEVTGFLVLGSERLRPQFTAGGGTEAVLSSLSHSPLPWPALTWPRVSTKPSRERISQQG